MADTIAKWLQGLGTLTIGIALLAGVIIAQSTVMSGGKGRDITVTGKAVRATVPNQSEISAWFEETAANQDEARNKTRDLAAKGIAAVKALGIDEKKISTVSAGVSPDYDYSNGKSTITGYRGSTNIAITLTDTSKADAIISALTRSGAKTTSGPTLGFSTATKDQLAKELRVQAIADAKAQAEALAKQAGGRLGKVISISGGEGISGDEPRPMYYASTGAADMASSAASDITVGDKEVSLTVTVSYQLR